MDVIYFDFQKAFDSVNHDILLHKLKYQYHIDGALLRFFVNYLKDRTQKVVIGNMSSTELSVNSGVPQGSIVGPTLFVLFINDIVHSISEGTNIALYADDTKIWRTIIKQDDNWSLQRDINQLQIWATQNKMKFHPDKTKVLPIGSYNRPTQAFIYTLEDKPIKFVESEKDLGINIDTKLNWNLHTEIIHSKANQKLGILKRNCSFVSNNRKRRSLYLALVRSLFEHCPIIWRPASKSQINKLESIQKRAFKWVNKDYTTSYSIPLMYLTTCKQLDILPVALRFDLKDLLFFHSIFYKYSVETRLQKCFVRISSNQIC